MMITREMVEAQRAQYLKRRQELWDNVNALSGAIDDCEIWLQILGMEGERDGEEEGRGEPSPLPLTPAPLPKGEGEEGPVPGSAIQQRTLGQVPATTKATEEEGG